MANYDPFDWYVALEFLVGDKRKAHAFTMPTKTFRSANELLVQFQRDWKPSNNHTDLLFPYRMYIMNGEQELACLDFYTKVIEYHDRSLIA